MVVGTPSIDLAVVAAPDARLQERACACVVLTPGATLTPDDVRDVLRDKGVTRHFWPERPEGLAEFPETPSGKLQGSLLRDRLRAAFDAAGTQVGGD